MNFTITREPDRQTSESFHYYPAPQAASSVWKRIKKTMKDRHPKEEFEIAPAELQELKPPPQAGDLEL